MRIVSKIALAATLASVMAVASASSPAQAHSYGWRSHHHHAWHHRHPAYARATSDYFHRSRMLVGTR